MVDEKNKWQFVFDDFSYMNPGMESNVADWYPSGQLEITLRMKDGKKYTYDLIVKRLRCVYRPVDEPHELSEEEWRREFVYQLEKKMSNFGISQKKLAEAASISQSSMSKYMNCEATPSSYVLHKFARALHCSVNELTYFER